MTGAVGGRGLPPADARPAPAAGPTGKPKPTRSHSFVLAVPIAVLLVWVAGLAALLTSGGDCFGSEAGCRAISNIQVVQGRVLVATVVGLSVLGFLAIAVGGRVVPSALLAASVATLLLSFASPALWWVPRGLGLILLPVAILALAAAGQVIDQVHWRPSWLRTWRGA